MTDADAPNGVKKKASIRTAGGLQIGGHFLMSPDSDFLVFHTGVVVETANVGGNNGEGTVGGGLGGSSWPRRGRRSVPAPTGRWRRSAASSRRRALTGRAEAAPWGRRSPTRARWSGRTASGPQRGDEAPPGWRCSAGSRRWWWRPAAAQGRVGSRRADETPGRPSSARPEPPRWITYRVGRISRSVNDKRPGIRRGVCR